MKKTAAVVLLLVVIGACFTYIILRILSQGAGNNFFNSRMRASFDKSPALRKIFSLHNDGDGAPDYLGPKYSNIRIEVDEMATLQIPTDSLDLLVGKMSAVTGKHVSYFISDTNIPYQDSVDINGIEQIDAKYRNLLPTSDTADVYLLYLSNFTGQSDLAGSTFDEDGILLFANVLQDFTKNNPQTLDNYVESTALHEFGHQLGLAHNNYSDCLMQAYIDSGEIEVINPDSVITDFCPYEKNEIAANKAKY